MDLGWVLKVFLGGVLGRLGPNLEFFKLQFWESLLFSGHARKGHISLISTHSFAYGNGTGLGSAVVRGWRWFWGVRRFGRVVGDRLECGEGCRCKKLSEGTLVISILVDWMLRVWL